VNGSMDLYITVLSTSGVHWQSNGHAGRRVYIVYSGYTQAS